MTGKCGPESSTGISSFSCDNFSKVGEKLKGKYSSPKPNLKLHANFGKVGEGKVASTQTVKPQLAVFLRSISNKPILTEHAL